MYTNFLIREYNDNLHVKGYEEMINHLPKRNDLPPKNDLNSDSSDYIVCVLTALKRSLQR